jgi:hypothetical protein
MERMVDDVGETRFNSGRAIELILYFTYGALQSPTIISELPIAILNLTRL